MTERDSTTEVVDDCGLSLPNNRASNSSLASLSPRLANGWGDGGRRCITQSITLGPTPHKRKNRPSGETGPGKVWNAYSIQEYLELHGRKIVKSPVCISWDSIFQLATTRSY